MLPSGVSQCQCDYLGCYDGTDRRTVTKPSLYSFPLNVTNVYQVESGLTGSKISRYADMLQICYKIIFYITSTTYKKVSKNVNIICKRVL